MNQITSRGPFPEQSGMQPELHEDATQLQQGEENGGNISDFPESRAMLAPDWARLASPPTTRLRRSGKLWSFNLAMRSGF